MSESSRPLPQEGQGLEIDVKRGEVNSPLLSSLFFPRLSSEERKGYRILKKQKAK
jgi:hypothetical protein